jgi:hypothetical protein
MYQSWRILIYTVYRVLMESQKEEDIDVGGRIIVKWIVEK